jgi:hypothetical protein
VFQRYRKGVGGMLRNVLAALAFLQLGKGPLCDPVLRNHLECVYFIALGSLNLQPQLAQNVVANGDSPANLWGGGDPLIKFAESGEIMM